MYTTSNHPDADAIKKRKVEVEVKCLTCEEGTLSGYFLRSDQSTNLTFRSNHSVYPVPNHGEAVEFRNVYHMVGPAGKYSVKCSLAGGDDDYIAQDPLIR